MKPAKLLTEEEKVNAYANAMAKRDQLARLTGSRYSGPNLSTDGRNIDLDHKGWYRPRKDKLL